MTIGQILKRERTRLNLTQEEMAGDILSRSYYSKVENDNSEITADKLIKLLKFHQINISSFIESLNNTKATSKDFEENLSNQLGDAFYAQDLDKVKKIKDKIDHSKVSDELKLRAILVIATLTNNFSDIDVITKQKIQQLLFIDNWTDNQWTLKLFGNSMQLFSSHYLDIYMSQVLRRYQNISEFPLKIQERICTMCINYLFNTYQTPNTVVWKKISKLLKNTAQYPSLSIYRIIGLYFFAFQEGDTTTTENILKILSKSGDTRVIPLLPKF
ncbi:helix-turn-helix transcriptional regulator [Lactobacillus sp.]|uniref:helix-turn-helix domain-containing protein n=1 Tax=Lactobacillus sp. TaxID=1591 RepID=UPI001983AF12|nr:helix-turn-helix transcriptional regulator [Lactobacillus sp.]MBD5429455.1 helix-turn-helix transcriptional regulator [Lactobacillus sp.]